MVFKNQKAFALALMCMTSLGSLQAGQGDPDQVSQGSVVRAQKPKFQIDEQLVQNGYMDFPHIAFCNSPVLRSGHEISLDATKEQIQTLCAGLVAEDVLVSKFKIQRNGPLFEALKANSDEKKWGYGILSLTESENLATPAILNLMRLMKEAGLDVTLRGNLNYPKDRYGNIETNHAELLVVGIKPFGAAPVKADPAPEVQKPAVKVDTPKPAEIPVMLEGREIGKLDVSKLSISDEHLTVTVAQMGQSQSDEYKRLINFKPTAYDSVLEGQLKGQRVSSMAYNSLVNPNEQASEKAAPILRRTWGDYAKSLQSNEEPVIVFFSGHEGGHFGRGGTDQSARYYMVDASPEAKPDYVFYLPRDREPQSEVNRKGWSYFPDKSAQRIVFDDSYYLDDQHLIECRRVLKAGGSIEFASYSSLSSSNTATISYDGKSYHSPKSAQLTMALAQNQSIQSMIAEKRQELAKAYYAKLGFSDVKFENGLFKLVK